MSDLIELLEASIKKHGPEKVLTLGHLLNIVRLLERQRDRRASDCEYYTNADWD